MKHKISVALLSTAFVLALASAGFIGTRAVAPAKAAAGDYQSSFQLVGPGVGVGWANTANTAYQMIEQADGTYAWTGSFSVERFRAVAAGTWNSAFTWDNVDGTSAKVADSTFVKASTVETDSDNNIWCKTAGTYTLTWTPSTSKLAITLPTTASYAISEYAVVDGTAETTAMATENAFDGTLFTPTDVNRTGFIFGGWYTDVACTTAYAAKAWTAAGNLYAKYTTVTERTIYFKTAGWTNTSVYTFGGDQEYSAWPGTVLTSDNVTNGVAYEGKYGIIKVTLTKNDTKVIFSDGTGGTKGTTQTYDLSIVDGAYYWVDAADGSTGDADKGSGAKVVYDINEARRAVTASGSILAGSICGISPAKAKSLLTEYDALNATAKGYVDAALDYTYDSTDTSKSADVPYTGIIEQLRLIAAKSGTTPAALTGNGDSSWTPAWIALISLGVAAVASAGLLISRRKHE
jgi:hypothetical protein